LQLAVKAVVIDHISKKEQRGAMGCPELLCSRTRLCRKTGERLHFITPTVEHPPAVLMWEAFAPNGIGQIRFLEKNETCNSTWYLKVLKQQVKWSANSLFGGIFYLQDDGAPCHRSGSKAGKLWTGRLSPQI